MKFQTFSIVVGNEACNAKCNFCIARMTPGIVPADCEFSGKRFINACRLAEKCDVTTALLTGKGEPTLFPDHLKAYIDKAADYFPLIELQTNGLDFLKRDIFWRHQFSREYIGLTTVALSIVHYEDNRNREIYCDKGSDVRGPYPPLRDTINFLQDCGLSVRLNCIGLKGYIDTAAKVGELLTFARNCGHEIQVTWRPVDMPDKTRSDAVAEETRKLLVADKDEQEIHKCVRDVGTLLLKLPHGAEVYDVDGQNLCLTNCLTRQPDDIIRQLIYADGRLRYDWTYKGALIL